MGVGDFDKPPEGPKIGPTKDFKELSPEKQAELGDLAAASKDTVFKPAGLDPRVAEAGQVALDEEQPKQVHKDKIDWAKGQEPDPRLMKAGESLDALESVLAREEEKRAVDETQIQQDAAPTVEDKQNLFRAILGGLRYEKTFELFGGMVRLVMVELTPREEDFIFAEMGRAQAAGAVKTEDDWMVMFERMRMIYGIKHIQVSGQETYERNPDKADKVLYADTDALVGKFKGSIVYQSLMRTAQVFRAQTDMLTEAAASSDFWKVDGQDSPQSPPPGAPSTTAVDPQPDRGSSSKESSSGASSEG